MIISSHFCLSRALWVWHKEPPILVAVLVGCVPELWKRRKSSMNAVDKRCTLRQELSTCNRGRNSCLDLVYQHGDQKVASLSWTNIGFCSLVHLTLLFPLPGIYFPHLFRVLYMLIFQTSLHFSERESLPTPFIVPHLLNILCISLTELLSIRNYWVYLLVYCLCLPIRIRLVQGKGLLCYSIRNSQHLEQCLALRGSAHVWDTERTNCVGDKTAHLAQKNLNNVNYPHLLLPFLFFLY